MFQFVELAQSCEETAKGLFDFIPHVPESSVDISAVCAELHCLGSCMRTLDSFYAHSTYRSRFPMIATDLELIVRASLRQTLRDMFDMTSRMTQAIHITNIHNTNARAVGAPVVDTTTAMHKSTWNKMWRFFYDQAGFTLVLRLKYYKKMLEEMLAMIQNEVADEVMLSSCRASITGLRIAQDRAAANAAQHQAQTQAQQHHEQLHQTQQQHHMPGGFPGPPPLSPTPPPPGTQYHHHMHHPPPPPLPPRHPHPHPPSSHPPPPPSHPPPTPSHHPHHHAPPVTLEHIIEAPMAPEIPKSKPKRKSSLKRSSSFERQKPVDRNRADDRYEFRDSIHWNDPTSPNDTSSDDAKRTSSHPIRRWTNKVFRPSAVTSTPLEATGDMTKCFGERMPDIKDHLEKGYMLLLELKFPGRPELTISFWLRDRDHRVRVLFIRRDGSCLMLCHPCDGPEDMVAWANLQFNSLEILVFFFSTFIALRGLDSSDPVSDITDHNINGEQLIFSGEAVENEYIHALNIYIDVGTKAVRLHSTVLHGELKNVPVWTAFIHQYLRRPREWMRHVEQEVIYLSELHPTIFISSDEYKPLLTNRGEHVITFTNSGDAVTFMACITEVSNYLRKKGK